MIKIDGAEIRLEGELGVLITEAAKAIHAVASAVSSKFKEEEGDDTNVDYDYAVKAILDEVAMFKSLDHDIIDASGILPDEIMTNFIKDLANLRNQEHSPGFLDYDTNKPDANAGRNIIQGAIKDVFIDQRLAELDSGDKKAIEKLAKKKKKKK
jgi:hypothetical protein